MLSTPVDTKKTAALIAEPSIKSLFISYESKAKKRRVDGHTEFHVGNENFSIGADNGNHPMMAGLSSYCAYKIQEGEVYQVVVSDRKENVEALSPEFTYESVAHKITIEGNPHVGCWTDGVSFVNQIGLLHEDKTYHVGITKKS